jgi:hypothetical protein
MFYDCTSPWLLKAAVTTVFLLTRTAAMNFSPTRLAALPFAIQLAMLVPSQVLDVRDRRRTTTLLVESAMMATLVCGILYLGENKHLPLADVSLALHMCTLHVFYAQSVALMRGRRLLAAETLCAWVAIVGSFVVPSLMVMYTPGPIPETRAAVLVLFSGEVLGTCAVIATRLLIAVADSYEAIMTRRE